MPDQTEEAKRSSENAEQKEKTKQNGVLFFFKNTINQGAQTENITGLNTGTIRGRRKNEKTKRRKNAPRDHASTKTHKPAKLSRKT